MRRSKMILALAAAAAALTGAAQAAEVEVRDAVARVVVIPEARTDVKVEFVSTNPSLPLRVMTRGAKVFVDGDLDRDIRACRTRGGNPTVSVSGVGDVAYADMPQVVVRTPMAAEVEVSGAVFGSIGRSDSLDFSNAGCGDWVIANVSGPMDLAQAGSGDLRAGSSQSAKIQIAGSGDVAVRDVRGELDVDLAGSGDVSVASVEGERLKARIAGSGDIRVQGGKVDRFEADIAGSGDVRFEGEAGELRARIAGSGDVHAQRVRGSVEKSVIGSGSVSVGEAS
ncbi:GIN domain-containing protein [Phenylobacterium sp.]|uniref:GIN domain-containing protein n=1 Tax=Phenylobacterium sp. TaxID=1871053 RepID=UPI0017B359C0|nr:DUF2807 domain-containing protein [Phenylobacterium sp.]MBA4792369.1 DUF2807 domain-containing protein [Phenylobacterium sp.]